MKIRENEDDVNSRSVDKLQKAIARSKDTEMEGALFGINQQSCLLRHLV